MLKKTMSVAAAALVGLGVMAATPDQADARGGRGGAIAVGLLAGALLGGYGLYGYSRPSYGYGYGPSYYSSGYYPRHYGWGHRRHWRRW